MKAVLQRSPRGAMGVAPEEDAHHPAGSQAVSAWL